MKQRAEWIARTKGTLGTHLGTLSAHLLGAFLPTHGEAAHCGKWWNEPVGERERERLEEPVGALPFGLGDARERLVVPAGIQKGPRDKHATCSHALLTVRTDG